MNPTRIFPVRCFQGYARSVAVFSAFTQSAAEDFCLQEKWPTQPNGFHCAPSFLVVGR